MEYLIVGLLGAALAALVEAYVGVLRRFGVGTPDSDAPKYMPGDYVQRIDGTSYRVATAFIEYTGRANPRREVKYVLEHHTGGCMTAQEYMIARKMSKQEYKARTAY